MYLVVLLLATLLFGFGFYFMKKLPKKSLRVERVIIIISFISYVLEVLKIGLVMGFDQYGFIYSLPLSNVSPFVFTLAFISLIFPEKIRKYFRPLLSILSFGFLLAAFGLTIYNYAINLPLVPSILFDIVPHLLLALLGIYYYDSYNEEYSLKHYVFAGIFMILVAFAMLGINAIFDTSFFGLNPYGKHNIYHQYFFESGLLSNTLYFVGLFLTLILGFLFQKVINIRSQK